MKALLLVLLVSSSIALPVIEKEKEPVNSQTEGEDWELNLEYGRYLKEVVQALESDVDFRKKLESANVEDIKSGKIARELPFVDHNVRTKLDELKRRELERLRHLALQEHDKKTGVDRSKLKIPIHIDHKNPSKFESEDLRKLIMKLNVDLEDMDKQRQDEFKKYEMEKEFEYKQELNGVQDETKKHEIEKKHDEELKKHKDHPKLHHPGSKKQFEEVWEDQDHMKDEQFDPRTFFHLHDLDGNGYWDENEVKALFQQELNKLYDSKAPEDDLTERAEEMERMRQHVFKETDTNGDNLISFEEFMVQTKKNDFDQDEGWQGLDEQEMYSQQEYEEYEMQRQAEIRRLIESGAMPADAEKLLSDQPKQQIPVQQQNNIPNLQQNNINPKLKNPNPPLKNPNPPQNIPNPPQNIPNAQQNMIQQQNIPNVQQNIIQQQNLGAPPIKPIDNNRIVK